MTETEDSEIILKGIGAAPGICIGKAYLVGKEGVNVIKRYHLEDASLDQEVGRFKTAVDSAERELKAIIADTPEEIRQHSGILEAHVLLLKDKMLFGKTIDAIRSQRINAEWALKNVVADLKKMFQKMSDAYFRERASDIVHVSDRIMRNLTGGEPMDIKSIDKRVILVAADLSPADTSQIQLERIKGLATDGGGVASHTGIIARTLEIPAVLGLHNATAIIRNDDFIVVDGTTGTLIVNPAENTLLDYEERSLRYERHKASISRVSQLPAQTIDGVSIQVMGNIELPEEVVAVRDYGGNGIGLYRTEFQYMNRTEFPTEDELFDRYREVVEVMAPYPVTIRTLDINGDKVISYAGHFQEANPALGLRAIRYCLKKPRVFMVQLRAILRAARFGNVRIMFPMISGRHEVREAKKILQNAAESLYKEGIPFKKEIQVGMMVEVPSAVVMADVLADEVDFFSIGTNDLIQYALAIDRGNRHVSHLYQPLHPAILRMIKRVSDVGHQKGIRVFMCGQMAGDPFNLPILLGMGIDELSLNPQSIPVVKNTIRSLDFGNARCFVEDVLKKTSGRDIENMLKDAYGDVISGLVYTG